MNKLAELLDDDPVVPNALTSFIVAGLERLEWELERIEVKVRVEELPLEDRRAISKAFRTIARECEVLRTWLRAAPIEELRN